jgi:hypothetical protein
MNPDIEALSALSTPLIVVSEWVRADYPHVWADRGMLQARLSLEILDREIGDDLASRPFSRQLYWLLALAQAMTDQEEYVSEYGKADHV